MIMIKNTIDKFKSNKKNVFFLIKIFLNDLSIFSIKIKNA